VSSTRSLPSPQGGGDASPPDRQRARTARFEHRFIGTTGGTIADELRHDGVPVRLLGAVDSVFAPARYRQGIKLARVWRPDLVHGAVMEGSTLGIVIARRIGVPMILEETSDPTNRRFMGHRLVRTIAAGATCCVAVSPAVGRYLTDQLGIAPPKVRVLTNGVARPAPSSREQRADLRRTHGIADDAVVIGSVARLFDDHKRITDLIAAFDLLATSDPRLHLVVVGSGPDRPKMEALATATSCGERIHFVGRHIPADPYYAIMDIFAPASSREALGLVAAEAMRAGLPVVATGVGGLAESVVDGVTGYLVPPLRPDRLAEALRSLVYDAKRREQMGAAGAERADKYYSIDRYLREVQALHLDVLERGSGVDP
jgi:L-malate glycosyltransferase